MHDFSHVTAFPAFIMAAFLAFALFMPLAAIATFLFARKAWATDGTMTLPWMPGGGSFLTMGWARPDDAGARDTGNAAFDTYRAETLARLDDEAKAFAHFRDRLQAARDREEFEHFIAEMRKTARD